MAVSEKSVLEEYPAVADELDTTDVLPPEVAEDWRADITGTDCSPDVTDVAVASEFWTFEEVTLVGVAVGVAVAVAVVVVVVVVVAVAVLKIAVSVDFCFSSLFWNHLRTNLKKIFFC